MKEPTQEQEKEFWEGYGFEYIKDYSCFTRKEGDEKELLFSGAINLNNLVKYAVPFLLREHTLIETYSFKQESGLYYSETTIWDEVKTKQELRILKGKLISKAFAQDFDLEKATISALFWALQQVKEASK